MTLGEEAGALRHQQLGQQQQQRAWTALRNPRWWVAESAAVAGMPPKVAGTAPDCQLNARFGGNVSPHPVTAPGERFVQPRTRQHGPTVVPVNVAAADAVRDRTVIRIASVAGSQQDPSLVRPSGRRHDTAGSAGGMCHVFGDLNTFRIGLVPQSEYGAQ